MVRVIQSESDAEWYAWRKELAVRHKYEVAAKEYALWKESQTPQVKHKILIEKPKQTEEPHRQRRFAF